MRYFFLSFVYVFTYEVNSIVFQILRKRHGFPLISLTIRFLVIRLFPFFRFLKGVSNSKFFRLRKSIRMWQMSYDNIVRTFWLNFLNEFMRKLWMRLAYGVRCWLIGEFVLLFETWWFLSGLGGHSFNWASIWVIRGVLVAEIFNQVLSFLYLVFEFDTELSGTFGFLKHDMPLLKKRQRTYPFGQIIIFTLEYFNLLLKLNNRLLHLFEMVILPDPGFVKILVLFWSCLISELILKLSSDLGLLIDWCS